MTETDSKRTTERGKGREGGQTLTKQASTVTAKPRQKIRSSFLLVKSGNTDLFHVSVFDLEAWNCPEKKV